jgi:polyvinyl alcohol dehydrogenase (cytochrome)
VFVPVSDVPDGRNYDEPAKPGLYALDLATGDYVWRAPALRDLCNGRPGCYPGYSAAVSVTEDYVLAGANDGWLRAFDIDDGALLWELDTTQPVVAVDGRMAAGGSIGGGQAPLIVGDRIILNSGYAFAGKMPGNALLVLRKTPAGSNPK